VFQWLVTFAYDALQVGCLPPAMQSILKESVQAPISTNAIYI